jgi:hypothetical protein
MEGLAESQFPRPIGSGRTEWMMKSLREVGGGTRSKARKKGRKGDSGRQDAVRVGSLETALIQEVLSDF